MEGSLALRMLIAVVSVLSVGVGGGEGGLLEVGGPGALLRRLLLGKWLRRGGRPRCRGHHLGLWRGRLETAIAVATLQR